MFVYQTRDDGVFIHVLKADESPLEPGVFLIPGGCVTVPPPPFDEDQMARWDNAAEAWVIEPRPVPEPDPEPTTPPDPPAPTRVKVSTVWARLTDDEAENLDAAAAAAPVRLRRVFSTSEHLDQRDTAFADFRGVVVSAVGEARADEVLEPDTI